MSVAGSGEGVLESDVEPRIAFFGVVAHKAGLCDMVSARRGHFRGLRGVWSGPACCPGELFTACRSSFCWLERLGWVGPAMCMTVFALVEIGLDFSYRGVS